MDHLRVGEPALAALLDEGLVLGHPWVTGELALGRLRDDVLDLLQQLPRAAVATEDEVLRLIRDRQLSGRGIGYVDVHLLAATLLTGGARLWTRDERLRAAAEELSLGADVPAPGS